MSLSMVVNWAQRQLVSMKAPVLFWQKQKRKSSLGKAALCREANGAELLPCSLAAIDQWFSCSATRTAAHILPLPCPEINVKVRKWSQRSSFLVRTYFSMHNFDVNVYLYVSVEDFNRMQRLLCGTRTSHSILNWYQYELLYSVIGFPQRLSSLQPIPSLEMHCRMKLRGIKWLINCWDKSINNAEIRDTATVSQAPLQDTSRERVRRKCPVRHHQCLQGLTCHTQQGGIGGVHICLSYDFFSSTKQKKNWDHQRAHVPSCAPDCSGL